jgi:hypothetical protein
MQRRFIVSAIVSVAYAQLRARAGTSRRLAAAVAVLVPVACLTAVSLGLQWVRFGMLTPSLIDDWFAVTYSSGALHALFDGEYLPSEVDFAGRFRPAYTAIWSYLQWHVPGGSSIETAAVWGMVRIAVFLMAVCILTRWLIGDRASPTPLLVWIPALAVALTPAIAVDLARYGPGEPMMVAGLVLGLALVGSGVRKLLLRATGRRNRVLALTAIAAGYVVYLFGVYSKEASICLLAFVPFFLQWAVPVLRGYALRTRTRFFLVVAGAFLVAPLIHLATHLTLAFVAGERPYPDVDLSLRTKLFAALVSPFFGAPHALGTWLWSLAVPAAVAVAIAAVRRRERDGWLLVGTLVTGFLMSAVALARGPTPSWYYIPWVVAVAVVAFRAISRTNVLFKIAVTAFILATALASTRPAVAEWAQAERSGSTAVEFAKSAATAGCAVYLTNFDIEQRVAIPQLFRFARVQPVVPCADGSSEAYAVTWQGRRLPPEFAARCDSDWRPVAVRNQIGFLRCPSLDPARIPNQVQASGRPDVMVVRLRLTAEPPSPERLFQPSRG